MSEKHNVNEIKSKARSGDSNAQYLLSQLLKTGKGLEKNLESYKKWLEDAAKNGNNKAMKELGDCYAKGYAVATEEMAAISWYRKAIEAGNVEANFKMAKILLTGLKDTGEEELPEDLKEAESLLRTAANEGVVDAQYELGLLFQIKAKGLTKDFIESERWLLKASKNDHLNAQNALGYLYAFGSEDGKVKENQEEAMKWWSSAAEKNHAEAQYNLGVAYARKAIDNWTKSSKLGDQKSRYMLNQIAGYEWGN